MFYEKVQYHWPITCTKRKRCRRFILEGSQYECYMHIFSVGSVAPAAAAATCHSTATLFRSHVPVVRSVSDIIFFFALPFAFVWPVFIAKFFEICVGVVGPFVPTFD